MKANIKFVSFSLRRGGAAIAAAKFYAIAKSFFDFNVSTFSQECAGRFQFFKRLISFGLQRLQIDKNPIKHSLNLFSYKPLIEFFDKNPSSIYHLHWFNNDTISVFDLVKIPPGSVITLHDEWLYCGSEHCHDVFEDRFFFENGYPLFTNRFWGFPWNYLIWRIKFNNLSSRLDLIYTVPSIWMLDRAKRSMILKNADVRLLPNPIDIDVFKPCETGARSRLRLKIGLSTDDFVFCFGASGGKVNALKGVKLLEEAFHILKRELCEKDISRLKIVVFGSPKKGREVYCGFEAFFVGHISNPVILSEIYALSDCVVVPSLVESFGQVAAESLSSGTPVISFACSGLTDIVLNNQTGLCAEPFSALSLAEKMQSMFKMSVEDRTHLSLNGRNHVVKQFSYPVIAERYRKILIDALNLKNF